MRPPVYVETVFVGFALLTVVAAGCLLGAAIATTTATAKSTSVVLDGSADKASELVLVESRPHTPRHHSHDHNHNHRRSHGLSRRRHALHVPAARSVPTIVSPSDNNYVLSSPSSSADNADVDVEAQQHHWNNQHHHNKRPLTTNHTTSHRNTTTSGINKNSNASYNSIKLMYSNNYKQHASTDQSQSAAKAVLGHLVVSDTENRGTDGNNAGEQLQSTRIKISDNFAISRATIISARKSLDQGATFINYSLSTNLNACLVDCWLTEACDTAVFQAFSPQLNKNHHPHKTSLSDAQATEPPTPTSGLFVCYLFKCAKPDGFKCQFAPHISHVSAIRRELGATASFSFPPPPPSSSSPSLSSSSASSQNVAGCSSAGCTTMPQSRQLQLHLEHQHQHQNHLEPINQYHHQQQPFATTTNEPRYARIVDGRHKFAAWHNHPLASITFTSRQDDDDSTRGTSAAGAFIAASVGIAATAMLVLIVGHKMRSIKRRYVRRRQESRRLLTSRSIDAESLISSLAAQLAA